MTSLPNPTPMPNKTLPRMSKNRFGATPLKIAATTKKIEASLMVGRRPSTVQAFDAPKLDIRAARYNEEVKS